MRAHLRHATAHLIPHLLLGSMEETLMNRMVVGIIRHHLVTAVTQMLPLLLEETIVTIVPLVH
jgi:hypothetical protein